MPATTHELKIHPGPFQATWAGRRRADLRRDDRPGGFRVGDKLLFREWDPTAPPERAYTGHALLCEVTDARRGAEHNVPEGQALLSFEVRERISRS